MDRRDYFDQYDKDFKFDRRSRTITIQILDDTVTLPAKFAVCNTCEGEGKHVNPDIDRNGLTAEDFEEDPDFRDDYFSGVYDVICSECKGEKVVPVVDSESLNDSQKKIYDDWLDEQDRIADERYYDFQVRKAECGYW